MEALPGLGRDRHALAFSECSACPCFAREHTRSAVHQPPKWRVFSKPAHFFPFV